MDQGAQAVEDVVDAFVVARGDAVVDRFCGDLADVFRAVDGVAEAKAGGCWPQAGPSISKQLVVMPEGVIGEEPRFVVAGGLGRGSRGDGIKMPRPRPMELNGIQHRWVVGVVCGRQVDDSSGIAEVEAAFVGRHRCRCDIGVLGVIDVADHNVKARIAKLEVIICAAELRQLHGAVRMRGAAWHPAGWWILFDHFTADDVNGAIEAVDAHRGTVDSLLRDQQAPLGLVIFVAQQAAADFGVALDGFGVVETELDPAAPDVCWDGYDAIAQLEGLQGAVFQRCIGEGIIDGLEKRSPHGGAQFKASVTLGADQFSHQLLARCGDQLMPLLSEVVAPR
jgi:hypothetical protein